MMLPKYIISKFKFRIMHDSKRKYSRRRYLINSIPLLSIVALLAILGISLHLSFKYPADFAYAAENTAGDNSASIIMDQSDVEVKVAPGEVGYATKSIAISTGRAIDYALTITAPTSVESDSGNTVLGGAGDNVAASDMPDNSWGYAYGQTGSAEEMTYSSFTGATQILESGNSTPSSDAKTLAFAAKFGDGADYGHYAARINLALTVTPYVITTYSITYNANGGTGTSDPKSQSAEDDNSTHTFVAADRGTLAKAGYAFVGWSESADAEVATYAPGSEIILSSNRPGIVLYAVWKVGVWSNGIDSGIEYMQDIKIGFCAGNDDIPTPAEKATSVPTISLFDKRDGNLYTIAKFQDGNCWMTQNLRLIDKTISYTGSDFTSGTFNVPASNISGFNDSDKYTNKAYLANNTAYYNWYTATAGAGNNSISSAISVSSSICPKQWKLPSGGWSATSDYTKLFNAIGFGKTNANGHDLIYGEPYNFSKSGRVADGALGNVSANVGIFWTSTSSSDVSKAHRIYITNSELDYNSYWYRTDGYAVRCMARY